MHSHARTEMRNKLIKLYLCGICMLCVCVCFCVTSLYRDSVFMCVCRMCTMCVKLCSSSLRIYLMLCYVSFPSIYFFAFYCVFFLMYLFKIIIAFFIFHTSIKHVDYY